MITFKWICNVIETCYCFICYKGFIKNDRVTEFFGGLAHWECFDKRLRENEKKGKEG